MKKEESYGSPEAALVNEILNYCKKLMHLAPSEKNAKLSAISSLIDRGADVNSTFEFNLVRRTSTDNVLDFLYFTGHRGTLLQFAANNGSVELVKLLLNRGADVTLRNVAGYTALRYAVENGDIDIVKALLEFGGDVNERDEDGKSLLHDAVRCGQINIVRLLLDHDAELEQVDRFGNTPAMEAFDWQRDDIFKLLIERGAGKVEGYSAFEKAIICDEFQEVSKMLDEGVDPKLCGTSGVAPLQWATGFSTPEMVNLLVRRGADVNGRDINGGTALHEAAGVSRVEAVKLLLELGADVTLPDDNGVTPLHVAAEQDAPEVLEILVTPHNIDIQDGEGDTLLHHAVARRMLRNVEFLVSKNARVDIPNNHNLRPIHMAVISSNYDNDKCLTILSALLEHGADPNARTSLGQTPLHIAVDRSDSNSVGFAELLLNKGAHLEAATVLGETPLLTATKRRNSDAVRLLIERGANLQAEDSEGRTEF